MIWKYGNYKWKEHLFDKLNEKVDNNFINLLQHIQIFWGVKSSVVTKWKMLWSVEMSGLKKEVSSVRKELALTDSLLARNRKITSNRFSRLET